MAQGTAFSYQGKLNAAGSPANGKYDLTFALFDGGSGAAQVGNTITNFNMGVTNGLFEVTLDFGSAIFAGSNLWLEVSVRTNGSGAFNKLTPRQQLSSVPYAVTAANVTGSVSSTSLAGGYSSSVAFTSPQNFFSGNFTGDGDNLTNLNASRLAFGTVPLGRLVGITSNQMDAATDLTYRHASNTMAVINVKDYGAVGDGFVNDSAAIAAAFHVWTNRGGTLYFPAGSYLDTNRYFIGPPEPLDYDDTIFYPLTIRGEGKGSTHWRAKINNATFITSQWYTPTISDISIENAGTGTNNGFYVIIGGPVSWYNVRFAYWTGVGVDMPGVAGGCIYGGAFEACGTGLRVPGYCDGWTGDLRLDGNTRAGIEIGGNAPTYPTIRHSDGGRWHVTGAKNYIAVLVGGDYSSGQNISGYVEDSYNCTVAIGHPPEWNDPEIPGNLGTVAIENMGVLNYNSPGQIEVLVRLYTPPSLLMLRNIAGGQTNVVSTSAACDATPVIFEGAYGYVNMLFSDGTSIPGSYPPGYKTVNLEVKRYNRANLYFDSATNGSVLFNGNLTVNGSINTTNQVIGGANGPRILSGIGSPLNVIAAPVGSLYLRTDGGPTTTLYVKAAGNSSAGWIAK